jgi:endonuclease-8
MPEGPEIRRAADTIARVLEGREATAVRFGLPRLRRHAAKLRGHRITGVETRGKALLTHFEHGWSIYSHNQLYGVWQVRRGHDLPQSRRSLRLVLQTETHSAILYSASDISVWRTEELTEHPFLRKLGPDIMNGDLVWRDLAGRLGEAAVAGRSLAGLYLDQGFLAGVGNYLRSEILFDAGVHPARRAGSLSRGERGRLARSTLEISRRSYRTGGITLKPRLAASLERAGAPRGRRRFAVFGRTGLPCYRCGEAVTREEISNRRLYWCRQCQPASP